MKRVFAIILGLLMLLVSSCTRLKDGLIQEEIPENGEKSVQCSDESDASEKASDKENNEGNGDESAYKKYSVKLARIDGEIYYETGEFSKMSPRCGTLDGLFEKVYTEYEVPKADGGANFEGEDYYGNGWQKISKSTVEVPTTGGWSIFRKAEADVLKKPADYSCCMRFEKKADVTCEAEEYLVFTNNTDLTFEDIKSGNDGGAMIIPIKYGEVYNWGITMSVKDVSKNGLTLVISQSGGNIKGELQTGTPFLVEMWNGSFWQSYDTISEQPLVWNCLAYPIMADSEREFSCDWSYVYGELPEGKYRISKEISDFYHSATGYDTHSYYAEFEIKQ